MAKKPKTKLPVESLATDRPYPSTAEDKARERRYQAKSDIETMARAGEIKKDKERMKAMKDHVAEQAKIVGKC